MSKALVINGANFSANKLTTVIFQDTPCTGISFSESSITLTDYDPVTLQYTVTPSNTTDEIVFTSSDSDVVDVDNGVITAVGLGTATVTVTCGNFSDTIDVVSAITYDPAWGFAYTDFVSATNLVIFVPNNMAWGLALGKGDQQTEYNIVNETSTPLSIGNKPIKIPRNTAKIEIVIGDRTAVDNDTWSGVIRWLKDQPLGTAPDYPTAIDYVNTTFFNPRSGTLVYDVPSGADAIAFGVRFAQTYSEGTDISTVVSNIGLNIKFLPADN